MTENKKQFFEQENIDKQLVQDTPLKVYYFNEEGNVQSALGEYTKEYLYSIGVKDPIVYQDKTTVPTPKDDEVLDIIDGKVIARKKNTKENLVIAKDKLLEELDYYDKSPLVNSFIINKQQLWLTKIERLNLKNRFDTELKSGKTKSSLWIKSANTKVELPITTFQDILLKLEMYAIECFDATQQHRHNIENIKTLKELKNYDYKVNYPKILNF